MRIGIDARLYGNRHTGIGRYTKNLILNLARLKTKHKFIIFGNPRLARDIAGYKNFYFVKYQPRVYTFAEQFLGTALFLKHKLDLLHIPHFNAPIFYPKPIILTVHDLIKHDSVGSETTTLPLYQYKVKNFVYRLAILINLKKAKAIITPSKYWQSEITKRFGLNPSKIYITHEAVDKNFISSRHKLNKNILADYSLKKPFIIYTGNLYPHKNLDFLVQTVEKFNSTHEHQLTLAIVSARSSFKKKYQNTKFIRLLGFVPDTDLTDLYSQAIALVQPSLIEGFGLTGLEAMAASLPVLSSNTTCLPEIYSNAALYFNPRSQTELIGKLEQIMTDVKLRKDLIQKGLKHVKHFSWYKTAKQTLNIYENCLSLRSHQ